MLFPPAPPVDRAEDCAVHQVSLLPHHRPHAKPVLYLSPGPGWDFDSKSQTSVAVTEEEDTLNEGQTKYRS